MNCFNEFYINSILLYKNFEFGVNGVYVTKKTKDEIEGMKR